MLTLTKCIYHKKCSRLVYLENYQIQLQRVTVHQGTNNNSGMPKANIIACLSCTLHTTFKKNKNLTISVIRETPLPQPRRRLSSVSQHFAKLSHVILANPVDIRNHSLIWTGTGCSDQGAGLDPIRVIHISNNETLESMSRIASTNYNNNEEKEQHAELSTPYRLKKNER